MVKLYALQISPLLPENRWEALLPLLSPQRQQRILACRTALTAPAGRRGVGCCAMPSARRESPCMRSSLPPPRMESPCLQTDRWIFP